MACSHLGCREAAQSNDRIDTVAIRLIVESNAKPGKRACVKGKKKRLPRILQIARPIYNSPALEWIPPTTRKHDPFSIAAGLEKHLKNVEQNTVKQKRKQPKKKHQKKMRNIKITTRSKVEMLIFAALKNALRPKEVV